MSRFNINIHVFIFVLKQYNIPSFYFLFFLLCGHMQELQRTGSDFWWLYKCRHGIRLINTFVKKCLIANLTCVKTEAVGEILSVWACCRNTETVLKVMVGWSTAKPPFFWSSKFYLEQRNKNINYPLSSHSKKEGEKLLGF